MTAEADVIDGTNVVNTEPKEKTEPRMDIVIDVLIYELKVKMKLRKLQESQPCDDATDDTEEANTDSEVRDYGQADGQLVHKPDEDVEDADHTCLSAME